MWRLPPLPGWLVLLGVLILLLPRTLGRKHRNERLRWRHWTPSPGKRPRLSSHRLAPYSYGRGWAEYRWTEHRKMVAECGWRRNLRAVAHPHRNRISGVRARRIPYSHHLAQHSPAL